MNASSPSLNYFVTGIDTDCGKTVVSALMCHALGADYWKPIQAGKPSDSARIKPLLPPHSHVHPESYVLERPIGPQAAAEKEGIKIACASMVLPTAKPLVIEGAGGLLVPLADHFFMIDLSKQLRASLICVVKLYLGCINHTLLTLEAMVKRNYPVAGLVFNGHDAVDAKETILKYNPYPVLLHLPWMNAVDSSALQKHAQCMRAALS